MDEIRKPKPFSHVIDVLRGRAAQDDDDQAKRAAADDEKDDKDDDKKAQGDEDDDKEKDKKTKKAQGDEDDDKEKKNTKKASDKDDEGRDNDERKGKAASQEDSVARIALWPEIGSDAADRADDRDQELAAARAREQGRIRTILNSEAGKANFSAAMSLALNSSLSRRAAIAVITAMPEEQVQPRRSTEASSLRERMAEVKMPAIQADAGGTSPGITAPQGSDAWVAQTAAAIVDAGKRRRGES